MEARKKKRILQNTLLVLGMSTIGLLSYYVIWMFFDDESTQLFADSSPVVIGVILVDYFAFCLLTTLVSLYYWRKRERTERERDKFRMQVLENQLSPHFVFNNFSILADLIEVDPKRASAYLMNLSKVYRYTLLHLDHDTVSLKEELEFIDKYVALLRQRFGERIVVRIAPELATIKGLLPPATLQMLIENAIKHNEHTDARPLAIDITTDGHSITVSNPKQSITTSESANVGQHNIAERYRLLTSQKIAISDNKDEYSVSIPLLSEEK